VSAIEAQLGRSLPDGYTSEVSLRLPGWVAALAATLERGLLLACDYGLSRHEYYHPERRDGTLICHYRHRAHADPFFHPGLQDITAWVDFSALACAAATAGLHVAGYATHAHFLMDAGLDRELAALATGDSRADLGLAQQAKTLLLPGEMGERFKVMALSRGDERIGGFGYRDLRRML
jgi:SAM-dependent MidA family methyltransferase